VLDLVLHLPPPPTMPEVASRSFFLETAVLAKQQKKVLRALIAEVGAGGSFEVVVGIARQEGLSKKALRALARDNAKKIKKYLVKRGIKGRDVSFRTEIYKVGRSSKVEVLGSKPNSA
jgi:2-hydroxychromene-2-carboxylate isomerase